MAGHDFVLFMGGCVCALGLAFFMGMLTGFPQDAPVFKVCPEPQCPQPDCPEMPELPELNCPEPRCPEPQCPKAKCPECDQGTIKSIIEPVAENHEYEYDLYDCTQFAEEAASRLRDQGWDAEKQVIPLNCDYFNCSRTNLHAIVHLKDVYIEATTGNIIKPRDYHTYNEKVMR